MEPSLWELCEGNLEEGHLYWESRRICKEGSGNGHDAPEPADGHIPIEFSSH
jgi:hypothetical protein